jgi:hypothetical protein
VFRENPEKSFVKNLSGGAGEIRRFADGSEGKVKGVSGGQREVWQGRCSWAGEMWRRAD